MDSVINHFFPRDATVSAWTAINRDKLDAACTRAERFARVANEIYYTPRLKTAKRSWADASASHRPLLALVNTLDRAIDRPADRPCDLSNLERPSDDWSIRDTGSEL